MVGMKSSTRLFIGFMAIVIGFGFGMYLAAGYHEACIILAPETPAVPAPEILVATETIEPEIIYLGKFTVTGYCPCEACCGKWHNPNSPKTASGTVPEEGMTVGADPGLFEMGDAIEIEGLGFRTVEDIPATWSMKKYRGHILDLYFDTHEAALAFGKRELDVWITK
jgi:3D (Asp-Asp-Asp) domain-containing protein